ncbi:hypothetical protein B5P43_15565 [Bacillus sp. SRB_336]|nr:hypothetical protein B5P43_15565 [Bacillus sp. SRB_336]
MNTIEPKTVAGLMDTARVAEYLGVDPTQVRTWLRRKATTKAALPALFPDPIQEDDAGGGEGLINRGYVWRQSEVTAFKTALAEYAPRGGRRPARLKDAP